MVLIAVLVGLIALAGIALAAVVAVQRFLAAAADRLTAQVAAGSRELDVRNHAFESQVRDVHHELSRMGDLVASLRRERAEQHGQLAAGLAEAIRTTTDLASTTGALREALASPKARGQWGERMADDVLRAAGMVEGVSYRKQTAIAGGTIPDFTFLLPQGRQLHMDVKFPVDNYLRHLEARSAGDADAARAAFLRDVRSRIKELSSRGYADPATTTGYLLLFIPNEAVYSFIHEHDTGILDVALGSGIVLCSPCTLFAVLGVIRQAVDTVRLEQASDEILEALSRFGSQWQKMSDHLDRLGKQLGTVSGTYDDIRGVRTRGLERELDRIEAIRTERGLDDAPATPTLREVV